MGASVRGGRAPKRDALHGFVLGRRVTPPPIPGRNLFTPPQETLANDHESFDHSASTAIQIVYVDRFGEESERRVSCRQIVARGWPEAIFGFCHERRAVREFRIDRIRELYDLSTGELRDPVPYFQLLMETGALGRRDEILCELARLLVFMARCDGDYHPLEEDAIEYGLGRYLRHYGGDDDDLEDLLERCSGLAPEGINVLKSLNRVVRCAERRAICRLILDCSGKVIDADGRHASEEVQWAVELASVLKSAAESNSA